MELGAAAHPRAGWQHRTSPPRSRRQRRSDADPRTALTAACSEDCTTSTGAHAQPEAVRLCPTPIVRLERALAHRNLQMRVKELRAAANARLPPQHKISVRWRYLCLAGSKRLVPDPDPALITGTDPQTTIPPEACVTTQ